MKEYTYTFQAPRQLTSWEERHLTAQLLSTIAAFFHYPNPKTATQGLTDWTDTDRMFAREIGVQL